MPTLITAIVGARFYFDAPRVLGLRQPGDVVTLRREKDNPHDANAVGVWWERTKIGMIPRADAPAVAKMLDEGCSVEAKIHTKQLALIIDYTLPEEDIFA
jgi:hypothetical protein